ncbi:LOW QUALITY PROTEIN: hypothetical protein Cgig2_003027 [Carnegiea gigantea]|uniref:Uncharacterized protein n=1 Tax=Carnegiea gigantea TaxID=171969 RepID=A0A9Q1GXP4_9CARY|nr:LOW QUALITY PROTEIN: hypothetical protein Cgig2_003027 [Carnegiea gigantea]
MTVLRLLKGILFAHSPRLMPDKANEWFCFPCDGPGREGTCIIRVILMYNAISVVIFHFNSKLQSDVSVFLFSECGYSQHLIESIAYNKVIVVPAIELSALSIIHGRVAGDNGQEDLEGITTMDPTIHLISFAIATAHVFDSYDDITEERVYQNIFASHFGQLAIIFLWTSRNLFHLNKEILTHGYGTFDTSDLLLIQFGTLILVNQLQKPLLMGWWYIIDLGTNEDLYTGALFLLFLSVISSDGGWLNLQPKWKQCILWFKNAESPLNHHFSGLFGGRVRSIKEFLRHITTSSRIRSLFYRTSFGIEHNIQDLLDAPLHFIYCSSHAIYTSPIHHRIHHDRSFFHMEPSFSFNITLWSIMRIIQASLCLGFYTLGVYVHNDVMLAFGILEKAILIKPIFAQWIQSTHGQTSYGFDVLLSSISSPTFNDG